MRSGLKEISSKIVSKFSYKMSKAQSVKEKNELLSQRVALDLSVFQTPTKR